MKSPPRIASLLPSATEIVVALGLGEHLVARSHECNYPPEVSSLPVCTGPKFTADGTSKGIDTAVRDIVQEGLSVYWVDSECLEELQPSVILTQSQCELCAVSMKDIEQAVCGFIGSRPEIISLEPVGYANIFEDFLKVGEALQCSAEASALASQVQKGIEGLASKHPSAETAKKRVCTIEWLDPLMYAGNWIPRLVEMAGGINCLGRESEHSHYTSFEEIASVQADVLLVFPCGFGIEQSLREIERLREHSDDWKRFIDSNELYICDGNQFFNRPGPRILESAEIIAEILYPQEYNFGHSHTAWIRLQ